MVVVALPKSTKIPVGSVLFDKLSKHHLLVITEGGYFKFLDLDTYQVIVAERMKQGSDVVDSANLFGYTLIGHADDFDLIQKR